MFLSICLSFCLDQNGDVILYVKVVTQIAGVRMYSCSSRVHFNRRSFLSPLIGGGFNQ